jgi:uncharacterized protein (DUF427 family)
MPPLTDPNAMTPGIGMGRMSTSSKMVGPVRTFLRTESGSAGMLVAAVGLALIWANVAPEAYHALWNWVFSVRIGPADLDLRTWVNSGLMTLFFLVVGLEAPREFNLGDLRQRRQLILPAAAAVADRLGRADGQRCRSGGDRTGRGPGDCGLCSDTRCFGRSDHLGSTVPGTVDRRARQFRDEGSDCGAVGRARHRIGRVEWGGRDSHVFYQRPAPRWTPGPRHSQRSHHKRPRACDAGAYRSGADQPATGRTGASQRSPHLRDHRRGDALACSATATHNGPTVTAEPEQQRGRVKEIAMGLAYQQGPLASGSVGQFLVADSLPQRLLFAEPLRRRMRVQFGGQWVADSEDVILLHEPGHYPVAFFPLADVAAGVLVPEARTTTHRELGTTAWFTVRAGDKQATRAAWQYTGLPAHATVLRERVAFAWRSMDAFYEEDDRILGHAADPYHRNDIRRTSRHLVVRDGDRVIADTRRPVVLYESGFAPRWYVPRDDIEPSALVPVQGQTFCPYKGLASYYNIGERKRAAWSYLTAWTEVAPVSGMVSFEPDIIDVYLDGKKLALEPGQAVVPHGIDRGLDPDELRQPDDAPDHQRAGNPSPSAPNPYANKSRP